MIVDHEFTAIQLIREYCRNMDTIEVVSIFAKALEAFEYLKENKTGILPFKKIFLKNVRFEKSQQTSYCKNNFKT